MTKLKQKMYVSMWQIRYVLLCISLILNAYKMIAKEFTGHKPTKTGRTKD